MYYFSFANILKIYNFLFICGRQCIYILHAYIYVSYSIYAIATNEGAINNILYTYGAPPHTHTLDCADFPPACSLAPKGTNWILHIQQRQSTTKQSTISKRGRRFIAIRISGHTRRFSVYIYIEEAATQGKRVYRSRGTIFRHPLALKSIDASHRLNKEGTTHCCRGSAALKNKTKTDRMLSAFWASDKIYCNGFFSASQENEVELIYQYEMNGRSRPLNWLVEIV